MEIVPVTSKKREYGIEILLNRKAELKQEIYDQKLLITVKAQNLLSPVTLTNNLFRSFTKGLNIVDGVLIGYKLFKSIRAIFQKFRK
jgi:hypothetical protein